MSITQSGNATTLTLTLAFRRRSSPWKVTREETVIVFTSGLCTSVRVASRAARHADVLNALVGECPLAFLNVEMMGRHE